MALNNYVSQTQRLLHDAAAKYYSTSDLQAYINEGRQRIAADGQCIRILLNEANIGLETIVQQEVYNFSTYTSAITSQFPGVANIQGVISIAVSWGSMKPMLRNYVWSDFQAYLRSYSTGLQNFPTVWSQYSFGQLGSVYLWPLPSTQTTMDWDAYCVPIFLQSDGDVEALPYPWTDCVQYYAASKAFENAQRYQDSDRMLEKYQEYMRAARKMSEAPVTTDFYPSTS